MDSFWPPRPGEIHPELQQAGDGDSSRHQLRSGKLFLVESGGGSKRLVLSGEGFEEQLPCDGWTGGNSGIKLVAQFNVQRQVLMRPFWGISSSLRGFWGTQWYSLVVVVGRPAHGGS